MKSKKISIILLIITVILWILNIIGYIKLNNNELIIDIILFLCSLCTLIYNKVKFNKRKKENEKAKKWLLQNVINTISKSKIRPYVSLFYNNYPNRIKYSYNNPIIEILSSHNIIIPPQNYKISSKDSMIPWQLSPYAYQLCDDIMHNKIK